MKIPRIQIFHLSRKLIKEMVPHVLQPSVDVGHDSGTVCSSKAYLVFSPSVDYHLPMRADTCPLYCRDLWMNIYHRGGHVCYLGFLQVSWNFFCVDIVVIIQKYNHEAVKLKKKYILFNGHSWYNFKKLCPKQNYIHALFMSFYSINVDISA